MSNKLLLRSFNFTKNFDEKLKKLAKKENTNKTQFLIKSVNEYEKGIRFSETPDLILKHLKDIEEKISKNNERLEKIEWMITKILK